MNAAIKTKNALDALLVGRDDTFKAKVLDLVVKNKWDADDPSFIITLATGQLQILLEDMPKSFESMSEKATQKVSQKLYEMQEWQTLQQKAFVTVTKTITSAGDHVIAKVKDNTDEVVQEIKQSAQELRDIRNDIASDIEQMQIFIFKLQKNHTEVNMKMYKEQQKLQTELKILQKSGENIIKKQTTLAEKLKDTVFWTDMSNAFPPAIWGGSMAGAVVLGAIGLGVFFGDSYKYLDIIKANHTMIQKCFSEDGRSLNKNVTCEFRAIPKK
jgi:hypothetical protein